MSAANCLRTTTDLFGSPPVDLRAAEPGGVGASFSGPFVGCRGASKRSTACSGGPSVKGHGHASRWFSALPFLNQVWKQ